MNDLRNRVATGQNQCFNALLFFFRYAREQSNVNFQGATRAKKRTRVPTSNFLALL
jgi:hypothetical protein